MKKGEKIIQIVKDRDYYILLTDKGNIYCGDFYLSGSDKSSERNNLIITNIEIND